MKKLTATLVLTFTSDEEHDKIDLQTNGVPQVLVLEQLNNLTKFLARQILEEECKGIPSEGQERYFNKLIAIERENLKKKLR
jgi:hypothetical protein